MYSLLTRVSNHMTQQLFNVCSCGKRIRFETPVTANVKKYTAGSRWYNRLLTADLWLRDELRLLSGGFGFLKIRGNWVASS